MKELVLQLSLLSTCLLFLFYPLPGTLPAGQGAPGLNLIGGQAFRLAGYFLYLAHSLGAIPFVCHPLSSPKEKRSLLFRLKIFIYSC